MLNDLIWPSSRDLRGKTAKGSSSNFELGRILALEFRSFSVSERRMPRSMASNTDPGVGLVYRSIFNISNIKTTQRLLTSVSECHAAYR